MPVKILFIEASKNAIVFLSEVINEKELKQCKKFLNDARLTYWGDMFKTLLGWTMLTRKRKSWATTPRAAREELSILLFEMLRVLVIGL